MSDLRLLYDEHVPERMVISHQTGFEVARTIECLDRGCSDQRIFDFAKSNKWIIVSNDTDFLKFSYSGTMAGLFYYPDQRFRSTQFLRAVKRIQEFVGGEDEIYGEIIYVTKEWLD